MLDSLTVEERLALAPVLSKIKSLGKPLARAYLKTEWPQYAHIHGELLELVPSETTNEVLGKSPAYDPHRRVFVAVAWLLGASMSQLGQMFDVAQQTIQRQIDRQLPRVNRHEVRLAQPPMDPAYLEGLRKLFYALIEEDSRVFDTMHPLEIAHKLQSLPIKIESEESGEFDELTAPERRLG